MQSHPDEQEFIERLQKGDIVAFQELYETCKDLIYRTCLRILGDSHDAEDVLHDTFVAVYECIGQFRQQSRLSTWIYQIAVHIALRKHARKKRFLSIPFLSKISMPVTSDTVLPGESDNPYIREEIMIQRALDHLPIKLKTCMVLRAVEGLSYKEIAQILKIPIGTVMSRINSARKKVRNFLKKIE